MSELKIATPHHWGEQTPSPGQIKIGMDRDQVDEETLKQAKEEPRPWH
jgi:hypothetical protein